MKTKNILLIFIAIITSTALLAKPPKQAKLTVSWSFVGIIDGYDHDSKCIVFIDGNQVGESTVTKESKPNSITVNVEPGKHSVRVMNYALYEGQWEEHTVANNYSVDCFYEGELIFKKKKSITLVFDIGTEKTTSKVK